MFGTRLRETRKENGYTLDSLAKAYNQRFGAGLNKGTLSKYENGKQEPMISVVDNLATILNVGTDYLLGKSNVQNKNINNKVPVLARIPAGIPFEEITDIVDYEEIDDITASKGDYFALKIKDNSMEPRICEGDIVIVRRQNDVNSGEVAIVTVNGNDATIKRLVKYADGIRLVPYNPSYEPIYFTNNEVTEKPVKIIGKVVENRQRY